jgi:methionine-rich copper-binding protein CopC
MQEAEPTVVEYLPAPQSVQPALPGVVLYLPAMHAVHVPPLDPVYPRLQRQLVCADDPETDCEFVGQLVHVEDAAAVEYVLALQSRQLDAPTVGECLPASQSLHEEATHALIYGQNLPAAQSVQTEAPLAENLPASHHMQSKLPASALYLPAAHKSHDDPVAPAGHSLRTHCMLDVEPAGDVLPGKHKLQS